MDVADYRPPPFAHYCLLQAWMIKHPAGYKPCRTCERPLPARDQHARCAWCRNAAGHLKAKYARTCPHCGVVFIGTDAKSKFCSRPCQQKGRNGRRAQ